MFNTANIAAEASALYMTPDPSKGIKIKTSTLNENVVLSAFNSKSGINLTNSNTEGTLPADRFACMFSLLRTDYFYNTEKCLIGANTSNDSDEAYYSASLKISFSDIPDTTFLAPVPYSSERNTWIGYIGAVNDYYLDLSTLAAGKRYCQIEVMIDPSNSAISLIEGHVLIHILTTNNTGAQPYVIFDKEPAGQPSQQNGALTGNVVNKKIVLDLQKEGQTYLVPFVRYDKNGDNGFKFSVGDPKDDAVVVVEEV